MNNHPRYLSLQSEELQAESRMLQIQERDNQIRERLMLANERILKSLVTMERANALVDRITRTFA